jgi:hypothetical protein
MSEFPSARLAVESFQNAVAPANLLPEESTAGKRSQIAALQPVLGELESVHAVGLQNPKPLFKQRWSERPISEERLVTTHASLSVA